MMPSSANDPSVSAGETFPRCVGIKASCRVVLALTLTLGAAWLSPAGAARAADQTASSSRPPVPVTLTVRFADGRSQFRPGETLPIELEFDSRVPKRFVVDGATYDRGGRLTIDEFLVEPGDAVTDPLLDYFAFAGGTLGGARGMGVLGEKPFTIKLDLNEWLRFEKAGRYTLSVRSQRVRDEANATTTRQLVVPVQSNAVSFEILPRDLDWEATELNAALQILNSKGADLDRRKGCRMLWFLGTGAAVDEMIKHFDEGRPGCDFEDTASLFSAPDRDRVVRQLERGIRANDQPVSDRYLFALALLSVYVQHPELRAPQTRETKGRLIPSSERAHLQDLVQAAKATYEEVLDAALPEKTARARAMILSWRLESPRRAAPVSPTLPASRDRLREQLAATFLELPIGRQTSLLEYQWPGLAGPAMVPVLRALVATRALASPSLPDLALRRLYELAPDEGRALILREIRNPSRGASLKTLGMLSDRELPELDEVLAANIDADQDLDSLSIRVELLHRYASPAVSARVLSRVDELLTRMACRPQAALLAYFLRANADLGRTLLDRALASRETTGCSKFVLRDVATLRMTPGVEAVAVAHLDDPDPQVVISAAEALGRHGSRASAKELRAQFERWQGTWAGRQEELRNSHAEDRPNAMQGMVELTFLQALGQGQAWLTDQVALRELRTLCLTDNCRTQADHMIDAAADTRLTIFRVDNPDHSLVMLAQYQLASIAALEQKLAQYPKGTSLTLDVSALDPQIAPVIVSEVMRFAVLHGITIRR
jgi:hypothetical protein